MAKATVTLTVNKFPAGVDNTQRYTYVRGTVAISASPAFYVAGGLALDWTKVSNLLKISPDYKYPIQVTFFSVGSSYYGSSGTYAGGFPLLWNKANHTLQIMANAGTQTEGQGPVWQELSDATAIPAQLSLDTILFEAVFVRSY